MDKDENIQGHEKRRSQVYAKSDDILVRILDIPEAGYECVMANSSWIDTGLLEGDIILIAESNNPVPGDIVLIEEEGRTRLGLASGYGVLGTLFGRRPLGVAAGLIGGGVG